MDNMDIHLKLIVNSPIEIEGIGELRLPTVKEVIDIGDAKYKRFVSMMTFSKKQEPNHRELEEFSDVSILGMYLCNAPDILSDMQEATRLFLGNTINASFTGEEFLVYFGDFSASSMVTQEKWELIRKIVSIGNYLSDDKNKEEEYDAGDDKAKELIEYIKKQKERAKLSRPPEKINTHSIISSLICRFQDTNEVLNKTIYQLYDSFYRYEVMDYNHYLRFGISAGNYDGDKIKLADHHWANIIETK